MIHDHRHYHQPVICFLYEASDEDEGGSVELPEEPKPADDGNEEEGEEEEEEEPISSPSTH